MTNLAIEINDEVDGIARNFYIILGNKTDMSKDSGPSLNNRYKQDLILLDEVKIVKWGISANASD